MNATFPATLEVTGTSNDAAGLCGSCYQETDSQRYCLMLVGHRTVGDTWLCDACVTAIAAATEHTGDTLATSSAGG